MPDSFNAYQKWLGIPLKDQPPNYYRLLGLDAFESDRDAIFHAADRQMAHVRTFQSGPYSDVSQQILNEISAAKLCLLNDERKAAYDADLQGQLASPAPRAVPPAAPGGASPASHLSAQPEPAEPPVQSTSGEAGPNATIEVLKLAGVGFGSAAVAALIGMFMFGLGPFAATPRPVANRVAPAGAQPESATGANTTANNTEESVDSHGGDIFEPAFPARPDEPQPASDASQANDDARPEPPGEEPAPELDEVEPGEAEPTAAIDSPPSIGPTEPKPDRPERPVTAAPAGEPSTGTSPAGDGSTPPKSDPAPPESTTPTTEPASDPANPLQPTDPPDGSLLPEDNGFFAGAMPPREKLPAPDSEEIATLIKDLRATFDQEYSAAQTDAEQAALARFLRDQARVIQSNEALRYAIYQEAHAAAIASGSPRLAIDIIDEWASRFIVDDLSLKMEMLTESARTLRDPQQRQQLAIIGLNLAEQAIRARRFDDAEKLATQARAVGGRDSGIRTQSIAATNIIKKARKEWAEIQQAIDTLETDPNDPAANLLYGRYLCLHESDWSAGLPLLAQSGDEALQTAAAADVQNPTDPAAQVAVAEQWYAIAAKDEKRAAFYERAAYWYELALDELVDLERVRVARRLETFPVYGPGGVITEQTELHVVGVDSSNGPVRVLMGVEGRPVVLVLTGNQAIEWQVEVQTGADLRGVILSGNFSQTVSGLPAGTRVTPMARGDGSKIYFHATSRNSANFNDVQSKLRALTGRPVASFDGNRRYRGNPIYVGP